MTNQEIAKEIVGAWGYEEAYWWEPIKKALDQKDKEKLEILDGLDAICEQHWDEHKMEVHLSVLRDFVEEQNKFITKHNE